MRGAMRQRCSRQPSDHTQLTVLKETTGWVKHNIQKKMGGPSPPHHLRLTERLTPLNDQLTSELSVDL